MPIMLKNVSYTYMPGTPFERTAVDNVSLTVANGEIVAVAGHTGSGKSTLVQLASGLLAPTAGEIVIDDANIADKTAAARRAKRKIGMVFQYPERQLFEETVFLDVAFGVKNILAHERAENGEKNSASDEEIIAARVKEALEFVDLDYEKFRDKSPFSVSGGEMRRIAIAGVIAMHPDYIVFDEPTAGLDPKSRENLLAAIMNLHRQTKNTIILVTHDMDAIARFAEKAVIMANGRLLAHDTPKKIFADRALIAQAGLRPPRITELLAKMKVAGLPVDDTIIAADEALANITAILKK